MAGKIGGVLALAALVGGILFLAAPGQAAEETCGPVTLDMLFPGFDAEGQPIPTTTAPPDTSSTVGDETSTTDHSTTTTTSAPTTDPSPTSTVAIAPPSGPIPVCRTWVYEMVWPLGVDGHVFSGFGADRDGGARKHEGNDIVAPKLAPVLAVADGTITTVHSTPPNDCCWMMITHDDGWQSLYVHLNNDTFQTDDGLGHGVRPGLEIGDRVTAGQVIGWVGDSGNAEHTVPHLHFELRGPDGHSVDPNASLDAAKAKAELTSSRAPYIDTEGLAIGPEASRLLTAGIFWPCDDRGLLFCPQRLATPGDAADLVRQMTGLTAPLLEGREQSLQIQNLIPGGYLADVLGCVPVESCVQSGITEADIARVALWADRALREADADSLVSLDGLGDARTAEFGLRALGRIAICQDGPDDERLVTRTQVMHLLIAWVYGDGAAVCAESSEPTS